MPDGTASTPRPSLAQLLVTFRKQAIDGPRLPEEGPADAETMAMLFEAFETLPPEQLRPMLPEIELVVAQLISHSQHEAAAMLTEEALFCRDNHFRDQQFLSTDFYNRIVPALVRKMGENTPPLIARAHDRWNAEDRSPFRRHG